MLQSSARAAALASRGASRSAFRNLEETAVRGRSTASASFSSASSSAHLARRSFRLDSREVASSQLRTAALTVRSSHSTAASRLRPAQIALHSSRSSLAQYDAHFRRTFVSSAAARQGAAPSHSATSSSSKQQESMSKASEEEEADPDSPPPKASLKERLRFLSRRYGWWAIGVYLLASLVDFSLVFLAIHMLGAEHIRELETKARNWIGLGKRDVSEERATGQGMKDILGVGVGNAEPASENNSAARKEVLAKVKTGGAPGGTGQQGAGSSTLWTEAVLAYTIHKTLLLPFRVAVTAAVLPSFVKLMVRWGLSRPNAVVRAAATATKKAAR